MATWQTFSDAFEAALNQALPSSLRNTIAISRAGGARQFGGPDGRLLWSVTSHSEDIVREADENLDEVASSNTIVLQVTAESQHDHPSKNALRLIEQVRLGLRKESVYAILDAAGISLLGIPMNPANASYPDDGRLVSAYAFDVSLRTVFTLTPEADDAIGLIETASGSGELEMPEPPNVEDTFSVADPTPEP